MRKQFLNSVYDLATKNNEVLFIGSDLGSGVLDKMKNSLPNQFYMEGVSEQYIAGFSSGLAMEGFRPYFNTIGSFLTKRCYEQIYIDICLHNLPVVLAGNGGGGVYAPLGPTHLNLDDFSILKTIPNLKIFAPSDANEMDMIVKASIHFNNPSYIRIGKGGEKIITQNLKSNHNVHECYKLVHSDDDLIITTGTMAQIALDVSETLLREDGIKLGVVNVPCIKPLDEINLINIIKRSKKIFVLEEHFVQGGLGSMILNLLSSKSKTDLPKINLFGINNEFFDKYGNQENLLKHWGLDSESIIRKIKNVFNR
jgi:transketolase